MKPGQSVIYIGWSHSHGYLFLVEAKLGTAANAHMGLKLDKAFTAFGKLREEVLMESSLNPSSPPCSSYREGKTPLHSRTAFLSAICNLCSIILFGIPEAKDAVCCIYAR
jgi:hypothetical protein